MNSHAIRPTKRRNKGLIPFLTDFSKAFYEPFKSDTQLFWVTLALCVFGLVILFSASAHYGAELNDSKVYFVSRQAVWMGIGFVFMWVLAWFKEARLKQGVWVFAWLTLGLLVLTQLVGDTANGSERWLSIGPIRFQTSELAKPAVALLLAWAWSDQSHRRLERLTMAALMCLGIIALIFKQPNLSITLLLSSAVLGVSFMAGLPSWLYVGGLPFAFWMLFEKIRQTPYQWRRIEGWLNPWNDPQDVGYNIIQSFYAIASGGLVGTGYGNSVQKLFYLPFQHTDFIFAIICDELGFLGAVVTLSFYGWLALRGFNISRNADTPFKQLLAFALTWMLVVQAAINISVATGLFPVTGVTLPLISYGGTSVVVSLAMIGLLFSLLQREKSVHTI
jgi:cell division protein FtsW